MKNLTIEERLAALREGKILKCGDGFYKRLGDYARFFQHSHCEGSGVEAFITSGLFQGQFPCTIYNPTAERLREVIEKILPQAYTTEYLVRAIESEFNITEKEK